MLLKWINEGKEEVQVIEIYGLSNDYVKAEAKTKVKVKAEW